MSDYTYDNDTPSEVEMDTSVMTSIHIDTPNIDDTPEVDDIPEPRVNDITLSSDTELTTIYDVATNTIINMYNFFYAYSEYCVDHNMV